MIKNFLKRFGYIHTSEIEIPALGPSDLLPLNVSQIQQFSSLPEPKVLDYPKTLYNVYWEIILHELPQGRHGATVRFYSREDGALVIESTFETDTIVELKDKVNTLILQTMPLYKKGV